MDEMRMAKFETFIEDINNAIKKRSGVGIFGFSSAILRATRIATASISGKTISPLGMIFDVEELNDCKFDRIIVYNAFPHFIDPEALVKHLATLLNMNGKNYRAFKV